MQAQAAGPDGFSGAVTVGAGQAVNESLPELHVSGSTPPEPQTWQGAATLSCTRSKSVLTEERAEDQEAAPVELAPTGP